MLRVTQRVLSVRTTLPVLRQRVPTLAFGRVGAAALPFTPVPCRFAAMGAPPGSNPGDDPAMKVSSEHNPFYGDPFMPREEVLKRIVLVVKNFDKVANPDAVTETSHFVKDLGLDSLDVVELVLMLEDEFVIDIPDDDAEQIHTVHDAIEYISHHPAAR